MKNADRFITGPIVIEPRPQPDGSIRYEVWDNGAFSFHLIETFNSKAEANRFMLTTLLLLRSKR